jgi:hypothetical protein
VFPWMPFGLPMMMEIRLEPMVGLVSKEEWRWSWKSVLTLQNVRGSTPPVGAYDIIHCSVTNLLSSLCHSSVGTSVRSCAPCHSRGGVE